MKTYEFGNMESHTVLIQPVDDHDMAVMEGEVAALREMSVDSFHLIAVKVNDWNYDLSPWNAPAVFGNDNFGDGAENMLNEILRLTGDRDNIYYIGGYSLAGLFSLWAAYRTDVFKGVAAVSPSVWFPGFMEYTEKHTIHADRIYLSLGDREEKTRNPVMSKVGDNIRKLRELYKEKNPECILEWNKGNHFREPDKRMAKGFSWVMNRTGHS